MEGVWAEEYEEDDFLDYYGEAEEVPDKEPRKTKLLDGPKLDETDKPKKTRVVLNPRPKLDMDRLLNTETGLPELLKTMSAITFRPGKEVRDMKRTLAMMETWSHRLFPKYTFDDFLGKCEILGKKRPIKTHLRKVRLGMTPF